MKKLIDIIEKLAEVPGALIRLVENDQLTNDLKAANRALEKQNEKLSSDVDYFIKQNRARVAELESWRYFAHDITEKYDIPCGGLAIDAVKKVFSDLELYKSRDIESRRWRRQVDEPCPLDGDKYVLWRGDEYETLGGKADFLATDEEWRYVSPEDMP